MWTQTKVECISQILTFSIFRFDLEIVLSFPLNVELSHNSQQKIGSDGSLHGQAVSHKAHTSMCVPPFKGDHFYVLETKCLTKSFMEKVPTSSKVPHQYPNGEARC